MIFALLVSANLFLQAHAQTPTLELWKKCSKNEDCINVAGVCESQTSINKKFKQQYGLFLERELMRVNCAETAKPAPATSKKIFQKATKEKSSPSPKCIKHQCEFI